jgi:hypothetical protein
MDEISYNDKCVTCSKGTAFLKTKRLDLRTTLVKRKINFYFYSRKWLIILTQQNYVTYRNINISYAC